MCNRPVLIPVFGWPVQPILQCGVKLYFIDIESMVLQSVKYCDRPMQQKATLDAQAQEFD